MVMFSRNIEDEDHSKNKDFYRKLLYVLPERSNEKKKNIFCATNFSHVKVARLICFCLDSPRSHSFICWLIQLPRVLSSFFLLMIYDELLLNECLFFFVSIKVKSRSPAAWNLKFD